MQIMCAGCLYQEKIMRKVYWAGLAMACAVMLGILPAGAGEKWPPREAARAVVAETTARDTALGMIPGGRVVGHYLNTKKDGRAVYKYLVVTDVDRIQVEVDAANGELVRFDRKRIESVKVRPGAAAVPDPAVSPADARKKALEKVGKGEVIKIEKDFKKDGGVVYEVDIVADDMKCEVEIDGTTGEVVKYKEKRFFGKERRGDRTHWDAKEKRGAKGSNVPMAKEGED